MRVTVTQWNDLVAELGRRAGGVRESGAFLLASSTKRPTTVARVVYFDDVDPHCLTGGISMGSEGFSALWKICTDNGLRVIADVHTHPDDFVTQSPIDEANAMIAVAGHVAVIVPHLAQRVAEAAGCGVHIYRGAHQWDASVGRDAARLLYIGRWA